MKRQAITPAMKISCLLYRWYTPCSLCGKRIEAHDRIEWDHIHALVHGGPHEYENLRPVHYACHKEKSALDVKANAKIKRLKGETCQGPKRKIPAKRKETLREMAERRVIAVRGSNDVPGFDLCVEAEMKNLRRKIPSRPFQKGRAA